MVGTPGIDVGLVRWIAARTCTASNRGSITISPPFSTVRLRTQVLAKTWKKGSTPRIRSSASWSGSIAFTCRALAVRFWCVSLAPFGVPVVPPVYWISAMSVCGSIATGSGRPSLSVSAEKRMTRGSAGSGATSLRLNRR